MTIKGFTEPELFCQAVERQLELMGAEAATVVGSRRTLRIAGREIVGFQVSLRVTNPTHSLTIQERGIGGRRSMGCGLFDPISSHA